MADRNRVGCGHAMPRPGESSICFPGFCQHAREDISAQGSLEGIDMKRQHLFAVLGVYFLAFSQPLWAKPPSPEARAAADRLIRATGLEGRIFRPASMPDDQTIEAQCVAAAAANPNPNETVDCKGVVKNAHLAFQRAAAIRESRKPDIMSAVEAAYAAHLSAEDMNAASTFYESAAGRRLIAASPAIAKEYEAANRRIVMGAITEANADPFAGDQLVDVLDPVQIDIERNDIQQELNALGIPADVRSCRSMVRVAAGVTDGAHAVGAVCTIAMSMQKPTDFRICYNDFHGIYFANDDDLPTDSATTRKFIRATCWPRNSG